MMRGLLEVFLYVDPGSGFLLVQMLVGAALSSLFYFRRAIQKTLKHLKALLKGS